MACLYPIDMQFCSYSAGGPEVLVKVASYGRRHLLTEEVPGLYIRRLTLEDPRSARERPASRTEASTRHICTSRSAAPTGRGTSRSWLEKIRDERPAFLTITSLELPECPIPLIESQRARYRSQESSANSEEKDDILEELLEKVALASREREKDTGHDDAKRGKRIRRRDGESFECSRELDGLEECTRNILQGPDYGKALQLLERQKDCICSEVSENLRINIRRKVEVRRSSETSSPEANHPTRVPKKTLPEPRDDPEGNSGSKCAFIKELTLNCSSVQLSFRNSFSKKLENLSDSDSSYESSDNDID
ncbi:uncharacterized protein LOC105704015 [Orussus abietinus]|uniref:uncharacterized protein LOC105704015 n=1 Tax=Orussus abietinus TaxID=222816 RepID=UPI000C715D5E|nr:uncharacterized protein LOC105704015 [Orussus abietinus]